MSQIFFAETCFLILGTPSLGHRCSYWSSLMTAVKNSSVNRIETLASMIMAGIGYGVLTQGLCQPYIEKNQLMVLNNQAIFENPMTLAWYERPEMPAYFQALIDVIN